MEHLARHVAVIAAALVVAAAGAASAFAINTHASDYTYGCTSVGPQPISQNGATVTASFAVHSIPCTVSFSAKAGGAIADTKTATYSTPGSYTLTLTLACGQTNALELDLGGAGKLGQGATCTATPPPTPTTATTAPTTTAAVPSPTATTAATTTAATVPAAEPTATSPFAVVTVESASQDALRQSLDAGDPPPVAALAARSAALNVVYGLAA